MRETVKRAQWEPTTHPENMNLILDFHIVEKSIKS